MTLMKTTVAVLAPAGLAVALLLPGAAPADHPTPAVASAVHVNAAPGDDTPWG
jgi:hypothetical protein